MTFGIDNPRKIADNLVDAYMARRALDYLVGFNISPILWTKLPGSKSAGRVQSVALRLLTEREHEIEQFNPEEFWTLNVNFKTSNGDILNSNIISINNSKVEKFSFKNKLDVNNAIDLIKKSKYKISDISSKYTRNPLDLLRPQHSNKQHQVNWALEPPELCKLRKDYIKVLTLMEILLV